MDIDTIRKNKPSLIDKTVLEKVIKNKKIVIYQGPTLLDKVGIQIKNYFYEFLETHIFKIIFLIIIVILLIYRYFQYKNIKQNIKKKIIKQKNFVKFYEDVPKEIEPEYEQLIELELTTYNSNNLGNYELL